MSKNPKVANTDFPLRKLPSTFPTKVDEKLSLGLDIGVGSCGQALVYDDSKAKANCNIKGLPCFPNRIAFMGVRAFDIPEKRTEKGIKLKNPERRQKRLMRRTVRRKARRLWDVKKLFKKHGLLPDDYPSDEKLWESNPARGQIPALDKWKDWHARMTKGTSGKGSAGPLAFRVKGLDKKLEKLEFAAALLHIAKHRGFKSTKKSDKVDDDGGKVIKAITAHEERMKSEGYRTFGEMLLKDALFKSKKRNSQGNYIAIPMRSMILNEIKLLFSAQRKLKNSFASSELEKSFEDIFERQRGLQNSVVLLGDCPFLCDEKRGARNAYSFELSRALQKLNSLSITTGEGVEHRLADFVDAQNGGYRPFFQAFGRLGTKSNPGRITWRDLRTIFNFDEGVTFNGLPRPKSRNVEGQDEPVYETVGQIEKNDFVTRNNANAAAKGSYLLRTAIGSELWEKFITSAPEELDRLAFALTFFEAVENDSSDRTYWGVLNELKASNANENLIEKIEEDLNGGSPLLAKFSGAVSLSSAATRKLLPWLKQGRVYSASCEKAFGNYGVTDFSLENLTNPVVVSVVRECLKQVVNLVDEAGSLPGRIVVELSRDMGRSVSERNEIAKGLEERLGQRNTNRQNLRDSLRREPNDDELLRYELWLEQGDLCPYCGETLGRPSEIIGPDQQIDHILPRSRSHDNSYDNKILVHSSCNQNKGSCTPFEFHEIGNSDEASESWRHFLTRVASMSRLRSRKRKNLTNTTFANDEAAFASRNLKDTQYIARLVTHHLQSLYTVIEDYRSPIEGGMRRVFAQPGSLTALVRKSWQLEGLKKNSQGERIGDKHHAVDALVCALLSEGQRQFITRMEQKKNDAVANADIFQDFTGVYKLMERQNNHRRIPSTVRPPWSGFREDVVKAVGQFTVSRRESRKGKGELHRESIYGMQIEGSKQVYYLRKQLVDNSSGKPKKIQKDGVKKWGVALSQVKGIELERNKWLKEALDKWVKNGCPVSQELLPKDPQGNVIKSVKIRQKNLSGRKYPRGHVAGGGIVRTDVYSQAKKSGKKTFFLVPVYSYHLSEPDPPLKSITRNKKEENWDTMGAEHVFEFSLWPNSRFLFESKSRGIIDALYTGVDRNRNSIHWANPEDKSENTWAKGDKQQASISVKSRTEILA